MLQVEFGEPPYSDVRLRDEFVLVGDVLLMPMRTFGVGSAGYAFPYDQYPVEHQFVTHGFQVREKWLLFSHYAGVRRVSKSCERSSNPHPYLPHPLLIFVHGHFAH